MQAFFFDPNSIAKYNLIMKLAHLFKYSFACIFATLSIAMTQQQNTQSSVQVIEEVNFKPHMVEHLIKGCPENSKCSKETGKTSEKFKEVFTNGSLKEKKSFVKEFGLPFTFWTTTVSQDSVITYQSRCIHHKTEKDKFGKVLVERQEIYEGIRFTKNINEITSFHGVILNQMIKEGSDKTYFIPRSTIPFFTNGDDLFFRQEFREVDYAMKLSPNKGSTATYISLATKKFPNKEILNTSCSKELVDKFKKINKSGIYQSAYCKMIYDTKEKKYHRYIFGWSC